MNDKIETLENAIRHINTAVDVDPWAKEAAVEAMRYMIASLVSKPQRMRGRWIDGHCSICGCDIPAYIIDWKWQKDMDAKFCPNCGSYNGGEQDEID